MRFTEVLWRDILDVYQSIINHKFIMGMIDGSLPLKIFKHYVVQDYLYLSDFARAVAIVGAKSSNDDWAAALLKNAEAALSIERNWLHEYLINEWRISEEEVLQTHMSPINLAYTSYLLATSFLRSFEEGLAAVLPCFWVYREVGLEMLKAGSPVSAYKRWIDTYSSQEYGDAVNAVIRIADEALENLKDNMKMNVRRRFRISTLFEYLFWDRSYHMEDWPAKPHLK